MRLIGVLKTERQAYAFYSFLLKQEVQNLYEPCQEKEGEETQYRIWVYNEDDLEKATKWLEQYQAHPEDPQFAEFTLSPAVKPPPPPQYAEVSKSEDLKWSSPKIAIKMRRVAIPITQLILFVCSFLYLWNSLQERKILKEKGSFAEQIAMTPLDRALFFDDPASYRYIQEIVDTIPLNTAKDLQDLPQPAKDLLKKAEQTPSWNGIYSFFLTVKNQGWETAESTPLFEKIGQGEIWRFFSPCLMHANFLHILFNMIWVWVLAPQIEIRLSKWKFLLLIVLIGGVSNTLQYLVGGPFFLGFSGIIVGMAGFIWMRQKKAPWEGYPLQKGTFLFLVIFVVAMLAMELLTFGLQLFSSLQITAQIANTAHITGGLLGMLLGRVSFFKRKAE